MQFATCSYPEYQPGMGIPVRTSSARPRHHFAYRLSHAIDAIRPARQIMNEPPEQFRRAYRSQLHRAGVDEIAAQAAAIVGATGDDGRPLVLMCFEDLGTGSWCHRSLFAAWWTEQTGDLVPELGELPPPGAGRQQDLF